MNDKLIGDVQMFVGSFEGDFVQFQTDTQAAIDEFKQSGVTRLIIDLSNNGGKYSIYPVIHMGFTLRNV